MKVTPQAAAVSLAVTGLLTTTVRAQAQTCALDFVSTAAGGAAMGPTGNIIAGSATLAPTCTGRPRHSACPASRWAASGSR